MTRISSAVIACVLLFGTLRVATQHARAWSAAAARQMQAGERGPLTLNEEIRVTLGKFVEKYAIFLELIAVVVVTSWVLARVVRFIAGRLGGTTEMPRTPRYMEIAGFLAWLTASALGMLALAVIFSDPPVIAAVVGAVLSGASATLFIAGRWLLRNERRGAATFAAFLVLAFLPLAVAWRNDLVLAGIAGLGVVLAILLIVHCLLAPTQRVGG